MAVHNEWLFIFELDQKLFEKRACMSDL